MLFPEGWMSPDRGDTLGLGNLPPQQQQKNQSDLGVAEILLTDKVSKIITTSSKKEPIITTTAGKQQSILPDKMSNKEQLANKPLNTSNHSTCHKHMPPTTKRSYFFKEMKCFVCLFVLLFKKRTLDESRSYQRHQNNTLQVHTRICGASSSQATYWTRMTFNLALSILNAS